MYQLMDTYSPLAAAAYFMLLILVGSFFCLNLTLAVIWDEFTKSEAALEANALREKLTRQHYGGVDDEEGDDEIIADIVNDGEDHRPAYLCFGMVGSQENHTNPIIRSTFALVESGRFEAFIVGCILVNTATLSMDSYPENEELMGALEYINFALTIIFVMEMVLKLIGLGPVGAGAACYDAPLLALPYVRGARRLSHDAFLPPARCHACVAPSEFSWGPPKHEQLYGAQLAISPPLHHRFRPPPLSRSETPPSGCGTTSRTPSTSSTPSL